MPRADYRCPECEYVERDVVFRMAWGAVASAPCCPCHEDRDIVMEVIPFCRFDVKGDGDGGKAFQKFDVYRQVPTRDGLVQERVTVDSLHKMRQIEHDSEQRFKDGEGEPLRFRAYANNGSNMDVNSFGQSGQIGERVYDSGRTPQKSGKVTATRHGTTKPKVPVARGGGASPLK